MLSGVVGIVAFSFGIGSAVGFGLTKAFDLGASFVYFAGAATTYGLTQLAVVLLIYQSKVEWTEVFQSEIDEAHNDDSISGPFWAVGYLLSLIIGYTMFIHAFGGYFGGLALFDNAADPGLGAVILFVLDQALRGLMFDVMEAYKLSISALDYQGGVNWFSSSVMLFRLSLSVSFFSTLLFAFHWYQKRTTPREKAGE
ncbi:hypothetical protein [Nisaea sp.]|uniref:hypothetical protein n=1 Tax=Nisaea sp. TaxID=2024842 RepID=UPI0032EB2ADD